MYGPNPLTFFLQTVVLVIVATLALALRDRMMKYMPAFIYGLIGASIGFITAVIVFPKTSLGDAARAFGLIALMLAFTLLFVALGRKIHYRPFQ